MTENQNNLATKIESVEDIILRKSILSNFSNFLEKILIYFSILLSSILIINVINGVIFRYFLKKPIFWTDELSLILFAWLTFLGGSLAIKRSEMPAVTLIIDRLTPKPMLIFYSIIQLTILFFTVIMGYYSFFWIQSPSVVNMTSSTLNVGMLWLYLIVPISMVCIFVFTIDNWVNYIKGYKVKAKWGAKE